MKLSCALGIHESIWKYMFSYSYQCYCSFGSRRSSFLKESRVRDITCWPFFVILHIDKGTILAFQLCCLLTFFVILHIGKGTILAFQLCCLLTFFVILHIGKGTILAFKLSYLLTFFVILHIGKENFYHFSLAPIYHQSINNQSIIWMSPAGNAASPWGLMRQSSYSYRVHTQKKQYLEDLFIIGDQE